jgi:hypothetical protein
MSKDKEEFMLTTVDNPFNPFTNFDEWFAYDQFLGHHSCSLLARVSAVAHGLSETDHDLAIDLAIDEIVRENVSGLHRKVSAPSSD